MVEITYKEVGFEFVLVFYKVLFLIQASIKHIHLDSSAITHDQRCLAPKAILTQNGRGRDRGEYQRYKFR